MNDRPQASVEHGASGWDPRKPEEGSYASIPEGAIPYPRANNLLSVE
jgi:hypothetical protein